MNHTETNEDWEKRLDSLFGKDKFHPFTATYSDVKSFIRSLRQSDKELILGKMVKKGYTQEQIEEYDETNSRDDAMEKGRMIGINQTLDTCKSIVEEVMK